MAYKEQKFISPNSEGWEVQDPGLDLVSGQSSLPGSSTDIYLLCLHVAERAKELSGVTFFLFKYVCLEYNCFTAFC